MKKGIAGFLALVFVTCCVFSYQVGVLRTTTNIEETVNVDKMLDSLRAVVLSENKEIVVKNELMNKLGLNEYTASIYAPIIYQSSKKFNVDWRKIASKIKVESNFNPYARSIATRIFKSERKERAIGALQIKPSTAKEICKDLKIKWVGVHMLYNPVLNIQLGTYYHGKMELILGGDFESAEKAYNVGLGGFRKGFASERHWKRVNYIYAMFEDPDEGLEINKDSTKLIMN